VIFYNEVYLISLSIIFIAFFIVLYIIAGIPHYPTPDENYYITNARSLLNYGKAFPASASFWKESLTMLFSSRIQWYGIIASFIASASILPANSNCVSLIFLLGICTASLLLVPERYRNHPLVAILPILVLLNPIFLILSGFALNDLAVAFYNVASLVFFINSYRNIAGKIEFDLRNFVAALLLQFFVFLIKPNLIFLIPYFLVLTINIFRFKLYKSKPGKAVTIFVILPILLYELILDIPRNLALYVLKNRGLELVLSKFLPVSLVEPIILMFFSVSYSPRTIFDYTALDYLWRFYIVFSPENLSIFVASIAIFLPFIMKRASGDVKFKNMVAVTLLAIIIQFTYALSSGGWGDIPRYYASVIAPLTIACMVFYFDWIDSKSNMMMLPLIGMLFLLWSNHVLTNQYGGVAVSWGVGIHETFNVMMLQTVFYAILTFVLLFLRNKITLVVKSPRNKMKPLRLKATRLILAILLLSTTVGNVYFSTFAYANSPSFKDYGFDTISNKVDKGIIFSNSYAVGTYASIDLFREGFISSMPPAEELDSLIRGMPNGTKLVIFKNTRATGLSESFVGSYPRVIGGRELITPSNATVWPTKSSNVGDILEAYFLSGCSNVTVSNIKVEPRFYNITWIEHLKGTVPYFGGSGSFIEIPYFSMLNLTPPYTIETWVIYEKIPDKDAVILDLSTKFGGYLLFIRNGKVWFANGFGNNAYTSKLTVNQGVWSHIVVAYNGTHSVFYVNGEREVVEGPKFKPLNETLPMWIGRYHWAFGSEVYYKGVIGVVNIYKRLLSNEEIISAYHCAFEPPYFRLYEKMPSPNGDILIYELFSKKPSDTNACGNIRLDCFSWSIANREYEIPDIIVRLDISAQKHCNITVVVSNDAFSRIQRYEVHPGANSIELRFKSFIYKDHSLYPYGVFVARSSTILVVDEHSNILFKDVISIFQFSLLQLVGYALLGIIVIILFLFFSTSIEDTES